MRNLCWDFGTLGLWDFGTLGGPGRLLLCYGWCASDSDSDTDNDNWTPWVDNLVSQDRGTLLGGISSLEFRTYNSKGGAWESVQGTWELFLFEGGDQPLGQTIDREAFQFSVYNLIGRMARKLRPFGLPLPSPHGHRDNQEYVSPPPTCMYPNFDRE